MDAIAILIFLSSGLFLGWSLGANDAANVFGTAVGSRMVKFSTAAFICSIFVIIGAVVGGAGAAAGLGELGAVNTIAGAFTAAFAAALTVFWMTKIGLPVSTTQAVVGAIIGWNQFSGSITDTDTLIKILGTWVACPILGAIFAAGLYLVVIAILDRLRLHLLRLDLYTRAGLILAGAFGSLALGANNIGNVMGVFVSSSPFTNFNIGSVSISSVQQLFLMGGIAIAIGVYTYSKRVMMTVGNSLMPLSPVAAFVVVVAHSLVLYIFSSTGLESLLANAGLPTIPLIPVSSSQAVVGGVIGIGLLKGIKSARQIRWRVLLGIASGWVSTPIIAAIISLVMLFILQNVFNQPVYQSVEYQLSQTVLNKLEQVGIPTEPLQDISDRTISGGVNFRDEVRARMTLDKEQEKQLLSLAQIHLIYIDPFQIKNLNTSYLNSDQIRAIGRLSGRTFFHRWQLAEALAEESESWQFQPPITRYKDDNTKLQQQLNYVGDRFHAPLRMVN
ncbi:inorganic phosphate transporter [Limnospira fusiformis KN01]|uniref:inorganic phosphate transporter n=1 Tax=Limnospira TaxID=2596745 RepID=UPI0002804565|nr:MULTISPECIES: inorganic phosphate transporter [Limnospira]EKD08748.1 phosphate transporter [Arthrospira platensis C1]QJB29216.1 inorganic phosphate transporter [Limnospira fusiformis SAG 85.79]MDT9187332.1 inorganic phosphate transporter [Limnospira sp. PMC 894.15]MDT9196739.1 inorganic phosphate transporter [Limnospira sp. PMC 1042.18]QNH57519.1 MAG: inorganic phosphate transporter [Limnospira indica BM01]